MNAVTHVTVSLPVLRVTDTIKGGLCTTSTFKCITQLCSALTFIMHQDLA